MNFTSRKQKNIRSQCFYYSWIKNSLKYFRTCLFPSNIFLFLTENHQFQAWELLFSCFFYKANPFQASLSPWGLERKSPHQSQIQMNYRKDFFFSVLFVCLFLTSEQYKYFTKIVCTEKETRRRSRCICPIARKKMVKYLSSSFL